MINTWQGRGVVGNMVGDMERITRVARVENKLTRKWYSSDVIEIECGYVNMSVIKCGTVNHTSKGHLKIKTQCSGIRQNVLVRL